jgi:hypothetical protein
MNGRSGYRRLASASLFAASAILWLMASQLVRADMFVSETTLVTGTSSNVASFTITSAEPVTVELSNLPWPQSLSSLSFMLSSADQVISSWSTDSSEAETYQLNPGTYYAHVTGTAGEGDTDLGLYSLSIGTQAAPVPLPTGGVLLISALLVLLLLGWLPRGHLAAGHPSLASS